MLIEAGWPVSAGVVWIGFSLKFDHPAVTVELCCAVIWQKHSFEEPPPRDATGLPTVEPEPEAILPASAVGARLDGFAWAAAGAVGAAAEAAVVAAGAVETEADSRSPICVPI